MKTSRTTSPSLPNPRMWTVVWCLMVTQSTEAVVTTPICINSGFTNNEDVTYHFSFTSKPSNVNCCVVPYGDPVHRSSGNNRPFAYLVTEWMISTLCISCFKDDGGKCWRTQCYHSLQIKWQYSMITWSTVTYVGCFLARDYVYNDLLYIKKSLSQFFFWKYFHYQLFKMKIN